MLFLFSGLLLSIGVSAQPREKSKSDSSRSNPTIMSFTATANSVEGITASGTKTHEGIVAADPAVLPLGSRIRIYGAGKYSGEYVVRDTGGKVNGRVIDIYMPSTAEAKRFGRRKVKVEVLRYGGSRP